MKPRICPYCGASVKKNKCDYCGQSLPNDFNISALRADNPWLKRVFTPYSIIATIFWTCCCIYNVTSIMKDGLGSFIGVSLFGYALFIIIANMLYYKKHPSKTISSQNTTNTYAVHTSLKPFDQMEGHEFEYYCADLLKKNGFDNTEVTKGSGDQGIDIIANKDGIKYGIQCKCYASDIGNKAVQEAFAGKTYYGCHIAAVLTNRYFTKSAKELAKKNGVLLWDRSKLLHFAGESSSLNTSNQNGVGTVAEARQTMQPHIDAINKHYQNRYKTK